VCGYQICGKFKIPVDSNVLLPVTVMFCLILLSFTHVAFIFRSSSEYMEPANPALARLHMVEHLDYKQDKSLSSASIVSKNPKQFLR